MLALGMAQPASADGAAPELLPVWTDHAVVQHDAPIRVAGTAAPHAHLAGRLGEAGATAEADATGAFVLSFAGRPASSAPVDLEVTAGGQSVVRHDLLVGEVWLCSGQSNMEFTVSQGLNAFNEMAQNSDPQLRLLTVPHAATVLPQRVFGRPAQWQASTPATAAAFSAACYYMARDLRKTLHMPVGVINASWGGSMLNPWLSPAAGQALYGEAALAMLRQSATDPLGAVTGFAPQWAAWYRGAAGGAEPWLHPDSVSWQQVPQISGWLAWTGTPLATHATGTVWLRRQITLTPAQAAAGAVLNLGILDDLDMTFVNGRAVGNTFGWDTRRAYRVPAGYWHAGVNEVMVAVTNSYADGGFASPADALSLALGTGETMSLGSGWRFSIGPGQSYPPRPVWDANGGIGLMHNGMIAPLGPIALRGIAWYQGESDTGTPGYAARLTALINGWRALFGPDLAVSVVQLANFGAPQISPGPSAWAALRDEQRQVATRLPHVALVTAIDIGERTDIHPANKQVLGQRLALVARGVAMPMPLSATREGSAIRVRFSGIDGGLRAWSGPDPLGIELCGAGDSDCRYARATIDGDSLLIPGDGRAVARVRHAWADSPVVNLFDARAMPVPGFALEVTAP